MNGDVEGSTWQEWVREHLFQDRMGFVIVAIVLVVAALGLNTAVQSLQLHFKKQRVEPARKVEDVPAVLGHWVQVSKDEPLSADTQETLGTEMFIFRDYLNRSLVGQAVIDSFKDKSFKERKEAVAKIQANTPNAVMSLGFTYYTGMVDTVAHIPERCYIADGYEIKQDEYKDEIWRPDPNDKEKEIKVRYITFEDQSGMTGRPVVKHVMYVFHANGDFECDPLGVRLRLQKLTERYGYYAKVELMSLVKDRDEARVIMQDFLGAALPELSKSFPDWNKLNARQ
jgi:hypothetical protein